MSSSFKADKVNLKNHTKYAIEDKLFCDVTFVCADGVEITAHKMVLVSTNSSLKDAIISASLQDPTMIILDGIASIHLRPILEYLYKGQVNLGKDLVDEVINVAEQLGLVNLIQSQKNHETKLIRNHNENNMKADIMFQEDTSLPNKNAETVMTKSEHIINPMSLKQPYKSLNDESGEFEETPAMFKIVCGGCDFKSTLRSKFEKHFDITHKVGKSLFSCKTCYYESIKKIDLKIHIKKSHTSSILCGQCDFEGGTKTIVKYHMNKNHLGLIFGCDICPYRAYYRGSITTHMNTVHSKDKSFACDL